MPYDLTISAAITKKDVADDQALDLARKMVAMLSSIGNVQVSMNGLDHPSLYSHDRRVAHKDVKAITQRSRAGRVRQMHQLAHTTMKAYEDARGDRRMASQALGIKRNALHGRLQEYLVRGWIRKSVEGWRRTAAFPVVDGQ